MNKIKFILIGAGITVVIGVVSLYIYNTIDSSKRIVVEEKSHHEKKLTESPESPESPSLQVTTTDEPKISETTTPEATVTEITTPAMTANPKTTSAPTLYTHNITSPVKITFTTSKKLKLENESIPNADEQEYHYYLEGQGIGIHIISKKFIEEADGDMLPKKDTPEYDRLKSLIELYSATQTDQITIFNPMYKTNPNKIKFAYGYSKGFKGDNLMPKSEPMEGFSVRHNDWYVTIIGTKNDKYLTEVFNSFKFK